MVPSSCHNRLRYASRLSHGSRVPQKLRKGKSFHLLCFLIYGKRIKCHINSILNLTFDCMEEWESGKQWTHQSLPVWNNQRLLLYNKKIIFWSLIHPAVYIWKTVTVRWCITKKWDVFSNFPLPAIQHGWAQPGMITGISVVVSRKYQLVCECTIRLQLARLEFIQQECVTLPTHAWWSGGLKCWFTLLIWKHLTVIRCKAPYRQRVNIQCPACGRPPWLLVPFLPCVQPNFIQNPCFHIIMNATNLENCSLCCMSTVAERDKSSVRDQEGCNVGKVQVCVWIELVHASSVACLPHWLVWGLDVLRVIECPQGHIWPLGIFLHDN